MPATPSPSSKDFRRVIEAQGFELHRQKGSHAVFKRVRRDGTYELVTLPMNKKDIPIGTLHSLIRQSGLTKKRFFELLVEPKKKAKPGLRPKPKPKP